MSMETEKPERILAGTYEVWTEGPGFVFLKPFTGCALEIDLSRYSFKSEAEAAALIAKMAQSSIWDTLILAGFAPARRRT